MSLISRNMLKSSRNLLSKSLILRWKQCVVSLNTPSSPALPVNPLWTPGANPNTKIIDNPKTVNPVLTPTSKAHVLDILVPAFTHLDINKQIPKQLPSTSSAQQPKYAKSRFAMNMLRIRRRKMKKHQLRKFRKRMLAYILKQRQKREIRKEKLFRAELLAKIKQAEQFNAEEYVNDMLNTIRSAPKVENKKERLEKVLDLIREHRKETFLIRPKFEDPVPEEFEKLK